MKLVLYVIVGMIIMLIIHCIINSKKNKQIEILQKEILDSKNKIANLEEKIRELNVLLSLHKKHEMILKKRIEVEKNALKNLKNKEEKKEDSKNDN